MSRLFAIFVLMSGICGLSGCIVAQPYGYAPAPAYGYAPAYYAAPPVSIGIGGVFHVR